MNALADGFKSEFVKSTPNLKRVAIRNWHIGELHAFAEWTKLESLDVSQSKGWGLLKLPQSLVHLNISQLWARLDDPDDPDPSNTSQKLPLLETLNCEKLDVKDDFDVILAWIEPSIDAGNLKSLNLGDCGIDQGFEPDRLLPCDSLVELSLKGLWDIPESKLTDCVRKYPNLRRLDLSQTRVTGVLVKEVMTREGGPLEFLGLVDATRISYDAIEWARSLGTTVQTTSGNVTAKKKFRDRVWE